MILAADNAAKKSFKIKNQEKIRVIRVNPRLNFNLTK